MMEKNGKMCGCMHHSMVPFFIVLIGAVFLLQQFDIINASITDITWPILIILIGLQKMMGGMCRCCSNKCSM